MAGHYSAGKRQRELDRARKKREKAERRRQKRKQGPASEMPMGSVEEITGALPSVEEAMQAIEDRSKRAAKPAPLPARLFVGGLSRNTTAEDLKGAFGKFGTVVEALVVTDRNTGDSRGFGFVTMEDRKVAPKAIEELHESELDGRTIVVNMANDRQR